ncbi:MAG TPA: cation:proton antiporter [Melioribacteraceae bacterium]|nr:cation:proton antiporter [Melioribacteraceae bacterium]
MSFNIVTDLILLFGVAVLVIMLFNRIKVPAVLGFLITGLALGPYGFGVIDDIENVNHLAEFGIILLLFTLGIEFSFREIFSLRKLLIVGGGSQLILTSLTVFIIAYILNLGVKASVFVGFLAALSNTGIVLKILSDKGELDTLHGKNTIAILIAQDLISIPMMLFIPFLTEQGEDLSALFYLLLKGLLIIGVVYILAKYIVPFLLYRIARTRIRELFLITILVICFGIVWFTAELGISVALGAFLAGLIISESEFSQQALSNILPFRDIFLSIFFVSIGMLLNFNIVMENYVLVILLSVLLILLKAILATISGSLLKLPFRVAVYSGLSISSIGEFSFILAKEGLKFNIINKEIHQLFLAVSIITIMAVPFFMKYQSKILDFIEKLIKTKPNNGRYEKTKTKLKGHLIIVGYGVNGKNLSKAAISSNIPYVVLEINPETVEREKKKGIPIYYGDAATEGVLEAMNITEARIIVIAINEPYAVRRVVSLAKMMNKNIHIIVRTRYISEIKGLIDLGADEVIPEEYETSIEIFTRVLLKYLIPLEDIENFIDDIRANSYKMFRMSPTKRKKLIFDIPEVTISSVKVGKKSKILYKTLAELNFRNKYKASVLIIRRGREVISNPDKDYKIEPNDILYLFCEPNKINELRSILNEN